MDSSGVSLANFTLDGRILHGLADACWCRVASTLTTSLQRELLDYRWDKSCQCCFCTLIWIWTFKMFQEATNLSSRPFLHNSTLVLLLIATLITCRLCNYNKNVTFNSTLISAIIAMLTHQLRDANRHGLWFHPVGSTKPIPTMMYITLICLTPLTLSYFIPATLSSPSSATLRYSRISAVWRDEKTFFNFFKKRDKTNKKTNKNTFLQYCGKFIYQLTSNFHLSSERETWHKCHIKSLRDL